MCKLNVKITYYNKIGSNWDMPTRFKKELTKNFDDLGKKVPSLEIHT